MILLSWGALYLQLKADRAWILRNVFLQTDNLAGSFEEHPLRTVEKIRAGSGTLFDPRLVDVFLDCAEEFDIIVKNNLDEDGAGARGTGFRNVPGGDNAGWRRRDGS